MEPIHVASLIAVACLHLTSCYPAVVSGFQLHYQPGTVYTYTYSTLTLINEAGSPKVTQAQKDVGFNLQTTIELSPQWTGQDSTLVKLTVSSPKLFSVARENVMKEVVAVPKYPVYFEWKSGKVVTVFIEENDLPMSVNIKKGIISLLQVHLENSKDSEIDASGDCKVSYTTDGKNTLQKSKLDCHNLGASGKVFTANPLLGPAVSVESNTTYTIDDDIIKTASALETVKIKLNIDNNLHTQITARQTLTLKTTKASKVTVKGSNIETILKNIEKKNRYKLLHGLLNTDFTPLTCESGCENLASVVRAHGGDLAPARQATSGAARAQVAVVGAARRATQEEITAVLKANPTIVEALIDGVAAAQTSAGQAALMAFLDFSRPDDITLPERYLLAVAFSTHPSEGVVRDLFELFKKEVPNENLRESIGNALGAVVYTYSKMKNASEQLIKEIESAMFARLSAPGCAGVEKCEAMLLGALMNAGLDGALPAVLGYARDSPSVLVAETAIKALRRMSPAQRASKQVKDTLKHIFSQKSLKKGYDSAIRSKALGFLLEGNPGKDDIREILREAKDPWNQEFNLFVQSRVQNLKEFNPKMAEIINDVLKEEEFKNWNYWAPKGKALAFTGYMSRMQSTPLNASYFMYVENSKAGIMKRSGMDVAVETPSYGLPLYNFGIFAGGLESLLGEEVESGQEDAEATAGISLDLLGVSLRPITFFTGQSGLMSAVWNAPSELTSALNGNLLLMDHSQRFHLQNGLVVESSILAPLSIDLSGSMSISLWNKNCETLVKNSGAVVVEFSTSIVTSSFRAGLEFRTSAQSVIDFRTDVDFYEDIKMCLQMARPDFVYRQTVTKFEHASGFHRGYIAKINREIHSPAVSYPLPKPNNKQCRALIK